MTTTKLVIAVLAAATSILNAQDYYPGIGHRSPWHHRHGGSTIITPDGPIFVPRHNDGPYNIITHDGPIFVNPNGNGGSTIITPDGPIFVHPN